MSPTAEEKDLTSERVEDVEEEEDEEELTLEEKLERFSTIMAKGKREMRSRNFSLAVDNFGQAAAFAAAEYGELAEESFEPIFLYGSALAEICEREFIFYGKVFGEKKIDPDDPYKDMDSESGWTDADEEDEDEAVSESAKNNPEEKSGADEDTVENEEKKREEEEENAERKNDIEKEEEMVNAEQEKNEEEKKEKDTEEKEELPAEDIAPKEAKDTTSEKNDAVDAKMEDANEDEMEDNTGEKKEETGDKKVDETMESEKPEVSKAPFELRELQEVVGEPDDDEDIHRLAWESLEVSRKIAESMLEQNPDSLLWRRRNVEVLLYLVKCSQHENNLDIASEDLAKARALLDVLPDPRLEKSYAAIIFKEAELARLNRNFIQSGDILHVAADCLDAYWNALISAPGFDRKNLTEYDRECSPSAVMEIRESAENLKKDQETLNQLLAKDERRKAKWLKKRQQQQQAEVLTSSSSNPDPTANDISALVRKKRVHDENAQCTSSTAVNKKSKSGEVEKGQENVAN